MFFLTKYSFQVSPSGKLVAYAEDTKGDEIYTVFVIDVDSGQYVGQPLKGITSDIEWAGDDNLVYITMDGILRPDKVCGFLIPTLNLS
jgi:oligopeptidase B